MVQVEHRKRFAGEEYLVVVQPDGTDAPIPAWKSEETARSTAITGTPCLSIDRLVELRVQLEALLASSDGELAPHQGGDHAITTEPAARPVRGRSKDVGHSEHPEASACQRDRTHAGNASGKPGAVHIAFFSGGSVGLTPASIRRLQSNVVTQINA